MLLVTFSVEVDGDVQGGEKVMRKGEEGEECLATKSLMAAPTAYRD